MGLIWWVSMLVGLGCFVSVVPRRRFWWVWWHGGLLMGFDGSWLLSCWVARWVSWCFSAEVGGLACGSCSGFGFVIWVVGDYGGCRLVVFLFFWWWWLVVASCGCGCGCDYGLLGLRRKWWVSLEKEKDTIRIERKKYSERIKIIIFKWSCKKKNRTFDVCYIVKWSVKIVKVMFWDFFFFFLRI